MLKLVLILPLLLLGCGSDDAIDPLPAPALEQPSNPIEPEPKPEPIEVEIEIGNPALVSCQNPVARTVERVKILACPSATRTMVILNGTGATCRFTMSIVALKAAKKGYFVACPESPNTGSGRDGMRALAVAQKSGAIMDYLLITGHSQGGLGSVTTAFQAQSKYPNSTIDILPMQPAFYMGEAAFRKAAPNIKGKKLVVCGRADTIVPCSGVRKGFASFKDPKTFKVISAGHLSPNREWAALIDFFD
jgi:hypothetical protein